MTTKARHGSIGDALAAGEYEKAAKALVAALVAAGGNQTAAAKALDVSDRQMRRWIAKLDANGFDARVLAREAGVELLVRRPRIRKGSNAA